VTGNLGQVAHLRQAFELVRVQISVPGNRVAGEGHHYVKVSDVAVRQAIARYHTREASQDALAAELGVSRRTVRGWINGTRRLKPTKPRMVRRRVAE
jgi:hypothetical protein